MKLPKHQSGLHAFVRRGPNTGVLLEPHLHDDGTYVVSKTKFEKDYIHEKKASALADWARKGYHIRMSGPEQGVKATSLIKPANIFVSVLAKA